MTASALLILGLIFLSFIFALRAKTLEKKKNKQKPKFLILV